MVRSDKLRHLPERFPVACQWELTCRCNLHCVMCYTDCFNRPESIRRELDTPDILHILDEMAEAGTLELCLTGGEPLIRPDFFTIYEHAIRRGFLVTVFTNGTLITEAAADRFARHRPQRIEISLHGVTTATFEGITQGPGSHRRCLDGIRLLLDRCLPLALKSTAMTLNRHEILAIKCYVDALDGATFKLGDEMRPELTGGAGPFRYALRQEELHALHRQDDDLWTAFCRRTDSPALPCSSGLQRFHIDAYGGLQLCSGNRRQSYDLRTGSFRQGFFEALPTFTCEWKAPEPTASLPPTVPHA
jgi:molybdenum cofactor biosynthesis enzyme MoaA